MDKAEHSPGPRHGASKQSLTHIFSHLDTIPEDVACLNYWLEDGQFVPIAKKGQFCLLTSDRNLDWFAPTPAITAADYVVGMELLGFRFWASQKDDGDWALLMQLPDAVLPPSWNRHSLRLIGAFPRSRKLEAVEYLRQREAAR